MTKTAFNKSLDLLARQDYSKHKLTQKLLTIGYEVDEIFEAIQKLEAKNLLNEKEYLRRRVNQLMAKGKSISLIQSELERENLSASEEDIRSLQQEAGLDASQQIISLIDKKCRYKNIGEMDHEEKSKLKQKILRFVLSKGHSLDECRHHLDHFFDA